MKTGSCPCLSLSWTNVVVVSLLLCFALSEQVKFINDQYKQFRLLTSAIPTTYDWRNHTNFTDVKNSGMCGASHAFATAAFFYQETISAGSSNNSINLSEMYLMACDPENSGCSPSSVETLLDYVIKKGGIPLESQYPYNPSKIPSKICLYNNFFQIPNVSRASYYELKDPYKLKSIILQKPAIAAVCGVDMAYYYPNPNDTSTRTLRCSPHNRVKDHHVLLVGYTETEWIIKNSWGSDWGYSGYAYISKNNAYDCCIGDYIHTTGLITAYCTVPNCQTCVDGYHCTTCVNGSYISYNIQTGSETCIACTYLNCQYCYNYKGTCKWCMNGYAINETTNKCVYTVISNCNRISAGGGCVQCKSGYSLSTDGLSCYVYCQVANCLTCPQGACLSCKLGYNLVTPTVNSKQIQVCLANSCSVANCFLCNSAGACLTCNQGFFLNSTTSQCYTNCSITDCISCKNLSTYCDICIDGKSWNRATNSCYTYSSAPNCKSFNTSCLSCKPNYQLDITANPFQCTQICEQSSCSYCQSNDLSYCVTCKDGYTINTTSYSSRCQKNVCNIANCSLCSSDGSQCVKCANSLFVFNVTSNNCENQCAITNCKYCLPTDAVCSNCSDGYVFNTDNSTCVESNITNCMQVYYAGVGILYQYCLECNENYTGLQTVQSFDQYCVVQCQANNCQACNAATTFICSQCVDETYQRLINGTLQCSYPQKYFYHCAFPSLNQSYCFECEYFYFLNQQTGLCYINTQNCPATCDYCTPSNYSRGFSCKCKNGLFFNKATSQCIPNPFNDTNCIAGSLSVSYSYCSTCNFGMVVNYTSWKSCVSDCNVSNCKSCASQSYMTCSVCNQGYYLNNELGCTQCTINDTNCKICISWQCLACKAGYHLDPSGMKCNPIQCNANQTYDGLNYVCPPRTFYANFTCIICNQPNCISCNIDSCFLCDFGFYLSSNQCLNCIPNCKVCTGPTTNCVYCNEGYFYDSQTQQCLNILDVPRFYNVTGSSVTICPLNCFTCTQQASCTQCLPNFHEIAGMCYSCQNNCKTCYRSNLTSCLSCSIGFHLTSRKSCIRCADINCKDCTISSEVCISCNSGFSLSNGTCINCQTQFDGCAYCNDFGQCTKCSSGYALMNDFTCQQCACNCKSCNSTAINQCIVECNTTYYLSNNTCVSCPSQCQTCTSDSICSSCIDGYILRNGQCIKPCYTGCFECDQSNTSKCINCLNSYSLLGNGSCSMNTACNNDNSCTFCSYNWVLINGQCQQCLTDNNCIQCSPKNTSLCIACKEGFYSSNGSCIQCSPSCKQCLGPYHCIICNDGYYKPKGTIMRNCLRCSAICKTCIENGYKCTSCYDGFYLAMTEKCLTITKIYGSITLNIALSSFVASSKYIRKSILSCLGTYYYNDTKQYIITKLYEGSVILSFTISIPEGLNQAQTYSTFKTNLANLNQIGGISVISIGQINLVNKTDNYTDGNNQGVFIDPSMDPNVHENTTKLAIILGVTIPGTIIILVVIFCIVRRKCFKKRITIEEEQIKYLSYEYKSQNYKSHQCVTLYMASYPMKKTNFQYLFIENNSMISQYSNDRLNKMNINNNSSQKIVANNKKSSFKPENKSGKNRDHLNIIEKIQYDSNENQY